MTGTQISGIGCGLGAAAFNTLAYLFSRRFVGRTGGTPTLLLVASHLIMGGISAALLAILSPQNLPPFADFAAPLAGAAAFYLVAQLMLFHVLKHVESSRVAPLLGIKVLVLACLAVLFLHRGLRPVQWAAVCGSVLAAWLLNEAGGRVQARHLALLGVTILGYCLSDLCIGTLMTRLADVRPLPAFTGAALTYVLCAVLILPLAFRRDLLQPRVWLLAAPFAVSWFGAMCLLYACFALLGVVFGNIVQSTRGIMAVVAAWVVARVGHTHLEAHVSRRVFWRRILGALLMMSAVALYLLSS